MRLRTRSMAVAVHIVLLGGCAHTERANTLASLRKVQPDTADVRVDNGLERAVEGYRQFLQQTPASELTPEAMRRLADLQLEREYGVRGTTAIKVDPAASSSSVAAVAPAGTQAVAMAAPESVARVSAAARPTSKSAAPGAPADVERQIEQRASQAEAVATASTTDVA